MVRTRPLRFTAALAVVSASVLLAGCHRGVQRPVSDVSAARITQIGINSYLWRSTLDTLSFMPMLQVDSEGGVILTDWFINPKVPGERMKLTVTILDQDLRADALRVAASRQTLQGGQWVDAPVAAATTQKLEDLILTHARDLRRREMNGLG